MGVHKAGGRPASQPASHAGREDRGEGQTGDCCRHVRVLVEELGAVVDFVVNHYIYVLFGVVFGNVLVAKL